MLYDVKICVAVLLNPHWGKSFEPFMKRRTGWLSTKAWILSFVSKGATCWWKDSMTRGVYSTNLQDSLGWNHLTCSELSIDLSCRRWSSCFCIRWLHDMVQSLGLTPISKPPRLSSKRSSFLFTSMLDLDSQVAIGLVHVWWTMRHRNLSLFSDADPLSCPGAAAVGWSM